MTNSKLLNISLVLFLFVLFSGMSFAANYNITECGSFSFPGLYELTHDIEKGSIDVFFGNSSETLLCSSLYFDWISCVNSNPSNPDLCNSNKENYEICLKSESLEEHRTACLNFRAMGGLDSDTNIVLDCKGHKIITDEVDFGILVYEPHAVLKYGGEESSWSSVVQNVEIRNCHIENSKTGAIALIDVRNINVINNTLVNNVPSENFLATDLMDCSGGIILMNSYYSNISYNNLTNNTFGICIAHSKDRKYLYSIVSTKNSIHNNVAYNNRFTGLGIAGSSHDNDIYENIFNENTYGVIVGAAYNNTFRNLTIMNNKYVDFAGDPVIYSEFLCQNYIDGANHLIPGSGSIQVTDGKLYFYNEPVHLLDDGINPTLPTSEVLICANDSNLTHFVLRGNPSVRNNGIFVLGNNLRVSGLTASDVMAGVYVNAGDNVVIQNSTFVDVKNGIMLNSVTNADISKNTFDDYRATGIVGFTSPLVIYELMTGLPPTSSQLSNISIYDNIFYGSDEVISVKDAYRGAFSLPGVKPIYLGDLLDLGTGSATSLLFAQNVNYYNNEIKKSQTYGFAGVFLFNSEIYDNIIENIQGISAYEITPGGFFESMDLDEMITMLPGTGVLLDSAFTNVSSNDILNSINGFVSLPFTSLFSLYISVIPSGPNYVYENKIIDNAFLGFGLLSPFNILHSNLVYGNNYTFAIMTEGNYVFNNFFNNTNEILQIDPDNFNEFNMTLTALPTGTTNIIGGDKAGGNFWGNSKGLGWSQICADLNNDGICDDPHVLTGVLGDSNNTDYYPLALSSGVVPPNCIDLDDVRSVGEVKNEWGHVVYNEDIDTFYINNNTLLCAKTYKTDTEGVFIKMNGPYSLNCNQGLDSVYRMESTTGKAIGILNYYDDVEINNCNFMNFRKGVILVPNADLSTSIGTLLFERFFKGEVGLISDEESFRNMKVKGNFVDGVVKTKDFWGMLKENGVYTYAVKDYSLVDYVNGDLRNFYSLKFKDDDGVSYDNYNIYYSDGTNYFFIKDSDGTPIEVVANVYEHPTEDSLYAYVIYYDSVSNIRRGMIIAYDINTKTELWRTSDFEVELSKGVLAFDTDDNLVVLINRKNKVGDDGIAPDPEYSAYLVKVNYTNGEPIPNGGVTDPLIPFSGKYNPYTVFLHMFYDNSGYIYDLSFLETIKIKNEFETFFKPPLEKPKIILQKYKADGSEYSNQTFEVPLTTTMYVAADGMRNVNVLFDGEYIYYTALDSATTGSARLYYAVFNLTLEKVADGEFKPNSEDVYFSSYLNENGQVEFLGNFIGNNSNMDYGYNFIAILNKTDGFKFTILNPIYIQEEYEKLAPVYEFVEIDSKGNSVVVGYDRYPRTSRVKISKYDSNGVLLYNTTYTPNELVNTYPLDFLINNDGNYLIGGYSGDKYFVSLFNSTNGSIIRDKTIEYGRINELSFFELENSYTVILYSRDVYNVSKSDLNFVFLHQLNGTSEGSVPIFYDHGLKLSHNKELGMLHTLGIYIGHLWEGYFNEDLTPYCLGEPETCYNMKQVSNMPYEYGLNHYDSVIYKVGGKSGVYKFYDENDGSSSVWSKLVWTNGTNEAIITFDKITSFDVNQVGEVYVVVDKGGENRVYNIPLNESGNHFLDMNQKLSIKSKINDISVSLNSFSVVGQKISETKEYAFIAIEKREFVYGDEEEGNSNVIALELIDFGKDKYLSPVLVIKSMNDSGIVFETAYYEVDSKGNYKLLFKNNDNFYPVKTFYVKDNIYTLMLSNVGEGIRINDVDLSKGNLILYSYTKNGKLNWRKELGIQSTGLIRDEIWNIHNVIDYDSSDDTFIISGTNSNNKTVLLKYDRNGNEKFNKMYDLGSEYTFNYNTISSVLVTPDKYYIIGNNLVEGKNMFSYIITTDKKGDKIEVKKIADRYNSLDWTQHESSNFPSDMISSISKDGKFIYWIEFDKSAGEGNEKTYLKMYDIKSKITTTKELEVPYSSSVKYQFDISYDGSKMVYSTFESITSKRVFFFSKDKGDTWESLGGFPEFSHDYVYMKISSDGSTIVIVNETHTLISKDDGKTFITKEFGINYGGVQLSGDGNVILFYEGYGPTAYISKNGGDFFEVRVKENNAESLRLSEDGSSIYYIDWGCLRKYDISTGSDNNLECFDYRISEFYVDGDSSKIFVKRDKYNYSEPDGTHVSVPETYFYSENGGMSFYKVPIPAELGWPRFTMSLTGTLYAQEENKYISKPSPKVDVYPLNTLKSYYGKLSGFEGLILTMSNYVLNDGMLSKGSGTLILDMNGDIFGMIDNPMFKYLKKGDYGHLLTYPLSKSMGASGYLKVDSNVEDFMGSSDFFVMEGAIPPEKQMIFDMQPTSYGILISGGMPYDNESDLGAGIRGYSFKKEFESSLKNIIIRNIGIYKTNSLLIDLTSTDTNVKNVAVGCDNLRCRIIFLGITGTDGYLSSGDNGNTFLAPGFVSIDASDLNAQPFVNTPAIIRLEVPKNAYNFRIIRADGFFNSREDILKNGYEVDKKGEYYVLNCPLSATFCEFKVDRFSSYTLGYTTSSGGGSSSEYKDILLTHEKEMCLDKEYEIKLTDLDDSSIPVKNAKVTLYDSLYNTIVMTSNGEGTISFTPDKLGIYRIKVDSVGDYRAIQLHENKYFYVKNCSSPKPILNCKEPGLNYVLTLDDFPTCKYECTILSCGENEELIDEPSKLRCYCKYVEPEEPEEPGEEDRKSLMGIRFGKEEFCEHEFFNLEMFSPDDNCIGDVSIIIPKIDFEGKTSNKGTLTLNFEEEGSYVISASKKGCLTTSEIIKIIDCSEDLYEPVIDKPLHEQLFNAINDFFRTSIKSGCEGFYFDGIPSIFCDLVWVVVILGSIAGAYLEPDRNKKVLILVTPSIIAVVFLPIAGALGAGVGVYLGYTSKKRLEEELLVEAEQMEEEIMK